MEGALLVLAIVVVIVAVDAIGRFDERRAPRPDEKAIVTEKIVVDLKGRRL